jgi:hypothetical protein
MESSASRNGGSCKRRAAPPARKPERGRRPREAVTISRSQAPPCAAAPDKTGHVGDRADVAQIGARGSRLTVAFICHGLGSARSLGHEPERQRRAGPALALREKRARGRVRRTPAWIVDLGGTMVWSTIVRGRTSWNLLHWWIALAGAGRRRPYLGTTEADRLVTKGSGIRRTRRRSRRSSPLCALPVMSPTGSGFAA